MKTFFLFSFLFSVLLSTSVISADFNGNGTDEIAIFRPISGLWAIRSLTRCYFGASSDQPVPGDYNGDGCADISIFRPDTGLWAIKNISRAYFGTAGDTPLSGIGANYNPDHFFVDPVTGYVGIKTDEPSVALELGQWADGADVIFHGDEASADSRLIWDSTWGALRFGGMYYSSQWNEETPGHFSLSVGLDAVSKGGCSAAIGNHAYTLNGASLAVGSSVTAGGPNSIAVGECVYTNGWQSMAFGSCLSAQTDNAIVIGKGSGYGSYPPGLANNIPDSLMVGFNTDTDPAFFVDSNSVGIKTTSPARALHVKDVMRLEPRSIPPTNPSRGDLYYDNTDDKLKCYNGTEWKDCF